MVVVSFNLIKQDNEFCFQVFHNGKIIRDEKITKEKYIHLVKNLMGGVYDDIANL